MLRSQSLYPAELRARVASSYHLIRVATETEIKLAWSGTAAEARTHLEGHGYRDSTPRVLEIDQLFDRASGELQRADQVLRLRRIVSADREQAVVTYKGPATREVHKSREEIEFTVSDPGAFCAVLERLAYQPGFRYEKYRTEFRADGEPGIVTLDETPIGMFLELEGPAYWIDAAAERLGFSPGSYLTESYARLYRQYQDKNPGVSANMTFAAKGSQAPQTKEP